MLAPEFLQHHGKRILRLDYSGLSQEDIVSLMQQAMPVIAAEPAGSVRLLSVVRIHVTEAVGEALKRFAAHNAPFVLASAIVGATPFQKTVIVLNIRRQGRKNVETFDDEERAKEWLAAQ
jgi:hypothetical protein